MIVRNDRIAKLRGYLQNVEDCIAQKKLRISKAFNESALTAESETADCPRDVEALSAYFCYKQFAARARRDAIAQTDNLDESDARPIGGGQSERLPRQSVLTKLSTDVRARLAANPIHGEVAAALERMRNGTETANAESERPILKCEEFESFFCTASKFVEKLLENAQTNSVAKPSVIGPIIPTEVRSQIVSDICWSSIIPEICLSLHSARETDEKAIAGDRIYVWNAEFPSRAEFELTATANISRAIFSPFNSEQVIAGMNSGQLCVYDLRAHKRPVLRSLPGGEGHKSPIIALEFIGGKQSNSIVCVSEDGRLCLWSLNKLDFPLRAIDLSPSERRRDDELAAPLEPYCLATIPNDASSVFVGASDATVHRFRIASTQIEEVPSGALAAHGAAVTCLAQNKSTNFASQLSESMLSGSLDWTVRLWSPKHQKALFAFELGDEAITDLQWNPAHPALFLAADAGGALTAMDLFKSFERPVWSRKGAEPILHAKWDNSGRLLAVATLSGEFRIESFERELLEYNENGYQFYEEKFGVY